MILIHSPMAKRRRIPLTPLIDVIFILVMFFLLSSTFGVWRPLDVFLGREGTGVSKTEPSSQIAPSVLIVAGKNGGTLVITVNGIDQSLEELKTELDRLAANGAENAIVIPSRKTDFQEVVRILDEARASKIGKVSLQLK